MMNEAGARAPRRLELLSASAGEIEAALLSGEHALNVEGDLQTSRDDFERAYQLAEQAGNAQAIAAAAIGLAGLWVGERRTVTGWVMLEARLQHALSLLDEQSPLALRLRARLAAEADYRRGEHAAILAVLDETRTRADPVPLAEALSLAHHCLLGPEHVAWRRELAVELIKVSFRTKRRSDLMMGLLWQTVDSYSAGDPHAGRLLGELRDELRQRDHAAVSFIVSAIDVMLAIRGGRLDEAESLADACARRGAAVGDIDCEWWPGAQLVTVRWYQGRLAELLPMLHERVHSPALSPVDNSAVAALATAAAMQGDRRTAASSLAALRGTNLASLPRSSSWLVTMNGVVEAAYLLRDADLAAEAYSLLRPYAQLPMLGGLGVTCFGATEQALGMASLTLGQSDRAIDHLRAAVQLNQAVAHWPALLSCRHRLAQALTLRGQPGDVEAAQRELEIATTEAATPGNAAPDQTALRSRGDRFSRGDGFAECERVGRKWRLTFGDRSILIDDSIGMVHLAVLIANPRQDIAAADLVAGLSGLGTGTVEGGAAQPVLDREAIGVYRNRLTQLDAEIDQAAAGSDEAASARTEREWLVAQLATASGLGGRTRSFPDGAERARVAVGKAIRRALVRISDADAVIGEHLRHAVHTGVRCSYWPG
jgi:tetratricopeptide (TPR) repeat protein